MNLKLQINQVKNIKKGELSLPIEKGIYCLVGTNGCGKSTVMSCLAQSIFFSSLENFSIEDLSNDSFVNLIYDNNQSFWRYDKIRKKWICPNKVQKPLHFNGMYEGSLFYGTRFNDSLVIDELVKDGSLSMDSIVDADDYIKEKMSFILQGDKEHYQQLKRVRNKKIATAAHLKNTPYFQVFNGKLVSQYRMSSGECLLISLLHFIYNALIRRSLPTDQPVLMLIDEIELALHPLAVSRLIDLLYEIIKEHENLVVVLSSHSPDVIRKINPNNIYMLEQSEGEEQSFSVTNPCYPSYAIRDVYMHDGFDYVILVEDSLAKYVVDRTIRRLGLNTSRLINILPVGGWENVLKFQNEIDTSNAFGVGTKVFSILDGDIADSISQEYLHYKKTFLPISSIEKFLLKVITDPSQRAIKKEINDKFFFVESLDNILSEYHKEGDRNGKILYQKLRTNLEKRKISEDSFIRELCIIIEKNVDFSRFEELLTKFLT